MSLTDVAAAGEGGRWEIVYSSILKSKYAVFCFVLFFWFLFFDGMDEWGK